MDGIPACLLFTLLFLYVIIIISNCGILQVAEPSDACSQLSNKDVSGEGANSPFVLIQRGNCSVETKVQIAQDAGFKAAIIYNNEDSRDLVTMSGDSNDLKGAIDATGKMGDHSVSSDVISVLIERSEIFTLDICTVILPLLTRLLQSETDRHLTVAMETLLVLVKTFGDVIRATISATPTIGVDLQAEQRLERCNLCYVELENIKQILVPLIRRGGAVAKSAQELSLALQEV